MSTKLVDPRIVVTPPSDPTVMYDVSRTTSAALRRSIARSCSVSVTRLAIPWRLSRISISSAMTAS